MEVHKHTHSLTLSNKHSLIRTLKLTLSLSISHAQTYKHTQKPIYILKLYNNIILTNILGNFIWKYTHTHTQPLSRHTTHTLIHTQTHTLSISLTLLHKHKIFLSPSLFLSHTNILMSILNIYLRMSDCVHVIFLNKCSL